MKKNPDLPDFFGSKQILRIMKVSVLLLFIGVTTSVATPVFSQPEKVNLQMTDVTLRDVFHEIEKQSDYNFFYNDQFVDLNNRVVVNETDASIQAVLGKILENTALSYKLLENNLIVITPKQDQDDKAIQTHKVTGTVVDEKGVTVAGASVVVKGTLQGIATDNTGKFTLTLQDENAILVISFIGYQTTEVPVNGRSNINVVLKEHTSALEEVVVTGYQVIESGRATGSFDMLTQKDVNMVVSTDIVDKLEGIVPGLSIDSNGEMLIRGQATIYAQTNPLVVVDGFPMEYGTYNINPNDIEQITVLKDAASASIWGVRAANGVIVITTKRGSKNEKVTVSYTGNVKIGSRFDLNSLGYLNTSQQIDWEREKFANYPLSISNIATDSPVYFSEAAMIEYKYQNGEIDEAGREAAFTQLGSYDNTANIGEYFYRNSLLQTHNIVVTGGSETMTNYLSVNFENSLGDLIGNDRSNVGVQFNNTSDLNRRFKLSTGFRANYGTRDAYTGDPSQVLPYVRIKDAEGNFVNEFYGVSQLMKEDLVSKGYGDWTYNRLKDRPLTENNTLSYNVAANARLDIDLFKGLKFSTGGMYIVDHAAQEILRTKESYYVRDLYNRFTGYDSGTLTNYLSEGAVKDMIHRNSSSYTFRNTLDYSYNQGSFHFSALGGTELFAIRTKSQSDTFYGYDPQGMNYNTSMNFYDLVNEGVAGYSSLGVERLPYYPSHSDAEDRYFSTFFTSSLSFTDRYTLFGSVRYDKTNLYGRSARYRDQPTWSVGGKWNLSQEGFFNIPKIDLFSVKFSYGLSGNVDKSTSPYLIASNERDLFLGLPVLVINNPANEELAWEKVYTFNSGIELAMFGNRLNTSADFYIRNTRDALGDIVMDPTSGWASVRKNSASLVNRGLDLSISGSPVSNSSWRWNSTMTFSFNYNEVTKINAGVETVAMVTAGNPLLGKPVDYVYAYRNGGLSETGQLQILDAEGNIYLYNETSGFLPEDLLIMGRSLPKFFGAWSNVISYKGFDLEMLVTYKVGHKIMMPSIANADTDQRPYKTFDNRWREPGDEDNTWVPAANYAVSGQYILPMNNNERMIEPGDLIRLKSIGLAYDLKRIIRTTALSALSIKLSVENPYYWAANSEGLDPDRLVTSYSTSYLGNQPTYGAFTLNVKF